MHLTPNRSEYQVSLQSLHSQSMVTSFVRSSQKSLTPSSISLFFPYAKDPVSALQLSNMSGCNHFSQVLQRNVAYAASIFDPDRYDSRRLFFLFLSLHPLAWLIEQRELSCEKLDGSRHSSVYSPPITSCLIPSKIQNTMI